MAKTADQLLAGLKRRGILPASQSLLSNADILAMADDIIELELVSLVMSTRSEFFVTRSFEPLVSGQEAYDIPSRSIGRGLRDLKVRDGSNTYDLPQVEVEDWTVFGSGTGQPRGFTFLGDKILIGPTPAPASGQQLELWWHLKPSKLVPTSQACLVDSVASGVITCVGVPSTFTAQTQVDIVQGNSGCAIRAMDVTIQNVSGLQLTFMVDDIPSSVRKGDYVTLAGYSPVLMLPDECSQLLETMLAQRVLQSLSDFEGAGALIEVIKDEKHQLLRILAPRVVGEPKKILNRNSLLRRGLAFNRFGWLQR